MFKQKIFLLLVLIGGKYFSQSYPQSNINLVGHIDPAINSYTLLGHTFKYSGCWGWYQDSTSKGAFNVYSHKEYALVGSGNGVYFVDISAPATPTVCDFVPGVHPGYASREIKTYKNYCYVASDEPQPNSFQIIDMKYLPDSVHVVRDDTLPFERAHTIFIDGDKLYAGGVTPHASSTINMRVYSLATPTAPLLLRTLKQDYTTPSYVHDMYVRNDTVFASGGYQGLFVYKFLTGSNTFTALGALTTYTESGYNHASWLTQNGKSLVFCDEVNSGLSIKCADVSNLSNISIASIFKPNSFIDFTAHNPYVKGNKWAFVSCYEDGLMLYDISNPASPTLAGYFDTYPQGGSNTGLYGSTPFGGNWGAYPYFPSGLILANDIQNGPFILEANALVGVKENEPNENLQINIYPNPASGHFNLGVKSNSTSYVYEIKNMLGETVKRGSKSGLTNSFISENIDISLIPSGIYLISVYSGSKNVQQKISITK